MLIFKRFMRDADSGMNSGGSADANSANTNNVNVNDNNADNSANVKTYTQDELNSQLKAQKKTITENLLKELGVKDFDSAKNGIKKYLEDIEKNKTDLEKANDTVNKNAAEIANLRSENNNLMLTNKALIAGVKSDNIADFVAIVNSRISDDKNADEIIKELKENSAYNGFFGTVDNKNTGTGNPIGQNKNTDAKITDYGKYLAEKWLAANKINNKGDNK